MADDLGSIINDAASTHGIDPNLLGRLVHIESGGNPNSQTGSYRGLGQFSNAEWEKYGGGGDIWDAKDNAHAFAKKLATESQDFQNKYGRTPSPTEMYMVHQQGNAGAAAHLSNPEGVAWQNVARYYPNESVAKSAIWNNIPGDIKRQNGWTNPEDVNKVTSGQFVDIWKSKVEGSPPPTFSQNYQPKSYLQNSTEALGRIPSDVKNYYNNIPASSGDYGPYNTIINGSNALIDGAIRTITRGQFGVADPLKAIGLPTAGLEQGIQDFHAAYPYGQVASDIGQFAGAAGPAGVSPPQIGAAVSRGTQLANKATDVGATAFEDAAAAQRQAGLGVFAPVFPGDPRYKTAMDLRNAGSANQKIWNSTKGKGEPGVFFDPAGNLLSVVPDVNAKIKPEITNFKPGQATTLGDIYDHPELYKKFPGMENTRVVFTSDKRRTNRMGLPVASTTEDGSISIPLPESPADVPNLTDHLRNQLVKTTQYLAEKENPLSPESFRDKPGFEEYKLNRLNDRIETALAKTKETDSAYRPLVEYKQYIKGYIDRVNDVKNLRDDPEQFVKHPIVDSTPYGRTLRNKVFDSLVRGKDPKITAPDADRVVAEALHNLSSGSQAARYAIKQSSTPPSRLTPPYQEGFPRSLARISPDASDQEIRDFAKQWYSHGSGRDFVKSGSSALDRAPARVENPIEPYAPGKADGGRVSAMDDSENTLRLSDLDDQDRYKTYRNRVEALKYLYPEYIPAEKAPPLPERNPDRGAIASRPTGEAPGAHYGEYNPLVNRQYMAYADVAKKPEQIGGENSFERLGGGDANLGFLIHLHNSGNPQATNAIRSIHQGRGDAGFWVKHLTKENPGFAAGGSVNAPGGTAGGTTISPSAYGGIVPGLAVSEIHNSDTRPSTQLLSSPPQAQKTQQSAPSAPTQASTPAPPMNPTNQMRQSMVSQNPFHLQNDFNQGGFSPMFSTQVTNPNQYNPAVTGGAPAAFAEGGQVFDYRKGGRARKINIPGEPSDLMQGRIAAQTHSSIGPYGGYIPPQLGAQNQQGSSTYAGGGEVTDSPDGNAQIDGDGMVRDPADSGTTTDQIAAKVPEDSHVIPYSALVKLGDGDPELGKQRLLEYIKHLAEETQDEGEGKSEEKSPEPKNPGMKKGGKAAPPKDKHVDIMISNKELVLTPDKVKKIGGGNIEQGHHELNKMRMKLRGAR